MIAWLHHAPDGKEERMQEIPYYLRFSWARLRRRIFFLRHFQRWCPRFFQTRELRFM